MPEPIPIVGTACRFPGECDIPSRLWELLKAPHDIPKKVHLDRFDVDHFYHPEATHLGTANATKSYFLEENIAQFAGPFFNIQLMESDSLDPQQRLLSKAIYDWLCTEDLPMENLRGSSTSDPVGMMCDEWPTLVASDAETLPTYTATGLARKRSRLTRLGAGLACEVKQMARKLHGTRFHSYLTILKAFIPRMLPDTSDFLHGSTA
ncbi:ketoacyl-synt-domain-containing protein [Aspergillus campestris IBT 28561]|uniref:Ketoacyl-synt-domain-containing protein n=1 Tax=Aspergillus campestris (strain IBT 28561) TaxID=1392248 RepID=A0A2I1DC17_ASPC2|nr:ketoacyl-synt-domain-containing protein [Aspergillus campestris IBT 28561]PKY07413.1 ketoacyl-synt-domain-containing protein [Aspergillus campestris IBT 28561]